MSMDASSRFVEMEQTNHFFNIPTNATSIRAGDALTLNCIYCTTSAKNSMIRFGVGHEDEMCGPIVLYSPHVKDFSTHNVAETS